MKMKISKFLKKFLLYMLLLICLEYLVDGQSEFFIHDVVLTIAVGTFFIIASNVGYNDNNENSNKKE